MLSLFNIYLEKNKIYIFIIKVRNGKDLAKNKDGVPFHPEGLKCLIESWYESLLKGCWSNWQVLLFLKYSFPRRSRK